MVQADKINAKRPNLSIGPFALFDVWQFPTLAWGDPTLPSALRRFTSEFGMGSGGTTALLPPDKFFFKCRTLTVLSGADTQSRTGDLTLTKGALYQLSHISTLNLMPGSSLLSHGETPHYHRRYGVSLLSSAWGQVGPPRYGRQANSVARNESFTPMLRWLHSQSQSHTSVCSFLSFICHLASA